MKAVSWGDRHGHASVRLCYSLLCWDVVPRVECAHQPGPEEVRAQPSPTEMWEGQSWERLEAHLLGDGGSLP